MKNKLPNNKHLPCMKLPSNSSFKAGLMLIPLGGVNLNHEPTIFNSTERPERDKFLIPSTWREMGPASTVPSATKSIINSWS